MTYIDIQLKQALAKMLPDTFNIDDEFMYWDGTHTLVLDTELLHLCWLVEETIDGTTAMNYVRELANQYDTDPHGNYWKMWITTHATWQQRVIALVKVKGVEIV